jgi:ParB/RepB/Spo0J family partition protein
MVALVTTAPNLTLLPVGAIDPNNYNPNRMTDEEFAEYVTEVRRLGRIPKPIVVRPIGSRYEIVDGEHAWRAANEVGFDEVLCEIVEADDFEARRQTLKRNQHGTHDALAEGLMLQEMLELRQLSRRGLADELNISEGTIRNRLGYVEALELRNAYAGADHQNEIRKMSLRQIDTYLSLPEELRDRWCDAGAIARHFDKKPGMHDDHRILRELHCITEAGLADLIDFRIHKFNDTFRELLPLAEWLDEHELLVDAAKYVRPVADARLSAAFLERLPCKQDRDVLRALLSPEQWREILCDCHSRSRDERDCYLRVGPAVRAALDNLGVDKTDVADPKLAQQLKAIQEAPEFIRTASFLSSSEKAWLAEEDYEVDADVLLAAKEQTCTKLRQQRRDSSACADRSNNLDEVYSVFMDCLKSLVRPKQMFQHDELFGDVDALLEATVSRLAEALPADEIPQLGWSLSDVLRDRLLRLAVSELHLIGGLVLDGGRDAALLRWINASPKGNKASVNQ